jgi:hypothetical protein
VRLQDPSPRTAHDSVAGAWVIGAAAIGDLVRQPQRVEHPIHHGYNLVVGDQIAKRTHAERLRLPARFPNMLIARRIAPQNLRTKSQPTGFFNQAARRFGIRL